MTSEQTGVIILGAGPVGLTLANELARHGVPPRIIDKAPGIREVSKAMILHVRTQEILDKTGIAARARAEAEPLREVVVHAYGKHIGRWNLDGIDSPYPHPLILGQNRTQHALLDLLASRGVAVEWNTEATALSLDDGGAAVTLGGETVRARFVVGCEGSNSLVRKTIGASFEGARYSGEQFIQADCRINWALPSGRSYLFLTADGYMMVIEFPGGVVRIFISLPDDAAAAGAKAAEHQLGAVESATETPALEEVQHHLTRLSGFACTLSDPIWLARYRTSHRYADRFSQGHVFIAGDAAHVHVPIGGQGMNTGIQDAFNLGWKLAGVVKGALHPDVLDTFHAERHPVAAGLIRGTNFAYRGILHPSEARQHAARLFGPFLIRNEHVQNFMRGTLEELHIDYPDSPLNLDLGGTRGPKPGERVPDATLVRASDHATLSINSLTRTTAWTLLLFGGTFPGGQTVLAALADHVDTAFGGRIVPYVVLAASTPITAVAPGCVLLDQLHLAHDRYGVSAPAFYLLRPDTYVGARGPVAAWDQLIAHLRLIFTA